MTTQLPLFSPGPPPDTEFAGVYDVPQAVRYIYGSRLAHEIYRVDSKKLIRWIRNGVASPGLARLPANRMVMTFEDLVSLRVIAALRAAKVNFRAIYSAEEWLRRKTDASRPFATEIVWTEGSGIFIELHERLISASKYGQLAMGRDAGVSRSRARANVQESPCGDVGAVRRRPTRSDGAVRRSLREGHEGADSFDLGYD